MGVRNLAALVSLGLVLAACGQGDSATVAGAGQDSLPEASFANTAADYCDNGGSDGSRIEMAFNATVTALEPRPALRRESEIDGGPSSATVPWATFEIHTWYTNDLGSTIGLWAPGFEGVVGERWLIASSRYSVAARASGDVYHCVSFLETPEKLEEWAAEYQGGVTPGVGTAETEADPELLAAIDAAEAAWLANAPSTYTITTGVYSRNTGFDDCGSDQVRLVVENGEVIQARDLSRHCDLPLTDAVTIERTFELARASAGATREGPEFDEEYGFIRYFYAADRSIEVGISTDNLRTFAYPLATSRQPAFDEARSRWQTAGIDDYTWTVETLCFCDVPGPIEITVEAGSITDKSVDVDSFYLITVEDLFDTIEANLDGDHIEVAYHPELGFPVEVHLDPDVETSDDETTYFVEAFTSR